MEIATSTAPAVDRMIAGLRQYFILIGPYRLNERRVARRLTFQGDINRLGANIGVVKARNRLPGPLYRRKVNGAMSPLRWRVFAMLQIGKLALRTLWTP